MTHTSTTRAPWRARLARPAFALLATLAVALPAHALEPFTAQYEAWYEGSRQGAGVMKLVPAGANRWTYSLDVRGTSGMAKLTGLNLAQRTTFEDAGGTWRPLSGSDSSKMLFRSSTRTATYDWGRGEARWTGDVKASRAGPVELHAGDIDAMLLNLALVRDVTAGNPLAYRLVDNGRAKDHRYTVVGKETIAIGDKRHEATKVSRTDGDRQTIAWIVDGIPVPARILQRDEGKDELDLRLRSIN